MKTDSKEQKVRKEGKEIFAIVWESLGVLAIFLLLTMPNSKTLMDMIMDALGVVQNQYSKISYSTIILAGIFLFVYLSSFYFFKKEKCTKIFATISSFLMVATIVTLIVYR